MVWYGMVWYGVGHHLLIFLYYALEVAHANKDFVSKGNLLSLLEMNSLAKFHSVVTLIFFSMGLMKECQ